LEREIPMAKTKKNPEVTVNPTNPAAPVIPMSVSITEVVPASAPVASDAWTAYIKPFADSIGKSVLDVTTALKKLVGDPSDEAVSLLQNEEFTPFDEIKAELSGVPIAKLRMAVGMLRKKVEPMAVVMSGSSASTPAAIALYDILPGVPDDVSFLEMLRTGGILKVGATEVISAIRAALANRVGIYELPNELVRRMETFAETQEEPCGPEYYKLRKMITRRSYAEIFAALDIDGASITQEKKNQLLKKLDSYLWVAISGFNQQLSGWVTTWQQGMSNPGMMMTAMAAMMAGGGGAGLPAGMMQPPLTNALRASAEGVVDKINRVFAGTGMVVARALAYDASNIKQTLENPSLPAQIGATSREQMLKTLGINVSSDYVLLEQNLTRYALSVMEFPTRVSSDREVAYLSALWNLGNAIPWDKLSVVDKPIRSFPEDEEKEERRPGRGGPRI
jgi:hypothetical protein